ncbi:MAG TPA: hypothetical protein VLY45_06085 [Nitrospiria bacterium]|nr:hypothetical protein [Nitrospiria bacterium]
MTSKEASLNITSIVVLAAALLGALVLQDSAIAGVTRTVVGTVTAVNTMDRPEVLVVKTPTAKGKDLTVGCRLDEKTVVMVGHRSAQLGDLQVGDRVHLTYSRVEDGLVCRTIVKPAETKAKQSG